MKIITGCGELNDIGRLFAYVGNVYGRQKRKRSNRIGINIGLIHE